MKHWLKVYRKMLTDKNYRKMDDVGRLGFLEMLLATDDYGNLQDADRMAYSLHRDADWTESALSQLVDAGWLTEMPDGYHWPTWLEYQESAEARRKREQRERDKRDERDKCHTGHKERDKERDKEREVERETVTEKPTPPAAHTHTREKAAAVGLLTDNDIMCILQDYNDTVTRDGGRPCNAPTAKRRARLQESASLHENLRTPDGWRALYDRVTRSDWLCGRKPGHNGKYFEGLSLEFIAHPETATKIMEGAYDNRKEKSKWDDV